MVKIIKENYKLFICIFIGLLFLYLSRPKEKPILQIEDTPIIIVQYEDAKSDIDTEANTTYVEDNHPQRIKISKPSNDHSVTSIISGDSTVAFSSYDNVVSQFVTADSVVWQ